eukprot:4578809-Prymnesium_polylepis.1
MTSSTAKTRSSEKNWRTPSASSVRRQYARGAFENTTSCSGQEVTASMNAGSGAMKRSKSSFVAHHCARSSASKCAPAGSRPSASAIVSAFTVEW